MADVTNNPELVVLYNESGTAQGTPAAPLSARLYTAGSVETGVVANPLVVTDGSTVGPTGTTVAAVAVTTASTTLDAANASRRGIIIYNSDNKPLYVKLGTAATTTDYSFQIASGGYWEAPRPIYTGAITACWASGTGTVRVTEITV